LVTESLIKNDDKSITPYYDTVNSFYITEWLKQRRGNDLEENISNI
jgi:hypothetical protein